MVVGYPIATLQFASSVLYALLGLFLFANFGGEFKDYWGFFLIPALGLVSAFYIRARKPTALVSSYLFLASNHMALLFVQFFFPETSHKFAHPLSSCLLLVAVVDAGLVMVRPARLANYAGLGFSLLAVLLFSPEIRDVKFFGPMILLLAWKVLVNFYFGQVLEAQLKAKQLQAFRATVVTLNHEFNNVAAIVAGLLHKINPERAHQISIEESDLAMLDRNLHRLVRLIKQFRSLKAYEEIEYLGEVKMVELPAEQGN